MSDLGSIYGLWQVEQGNRIRRQDHHEPDRCSAGTSSDEYRSLPALENRPAPAWFTDHLQSLRAKRSNPEYRQIARWIASSLSLLGRKSLKTVSYYQHRASNFHPRRVGALSTGPNSQ